ncbi:DUF1801 domain-containing protein [Isoptericola sp. NPDC056618]|uniref:DUF1801 domain-containing protein n=1 Tax=unclassified Isoptericola TaxID=2623355 RepID=UPI0036584610
MGEDGRDDQGDVAAVLDGLAPPVRAVTERLRALVAEVLPDAVEEPDPSARLLGYTYRPGTYVGLVAAVAPYRRHVNLVLARGAALVDDDPHGLLEGAGRRARHVAFRTEEDVDRPGVRELLLAAARRTPRP